MNKKKKMQLVRSISIDRKKTAPSTEELDKSLMS